MPRRMAQRLLEAVEEQPAVRQVGEAVVRRRVSEPLVLVCALGDVAPERGEARPECADDLLLVIERAALPAVAEDGAKLLARVQRAPERPVEVGFMAAGLQQRRP